MEIIYEWKRHPDGDGVICDSCNADAPVSTFPHHRDFPEEKTWELCELCSASMVSVVSQYPEQHQNVELYQSIAMIGNIIIDKCTGRTRPKETP